MILKVLSSCQSMINFTDKHPNFKWTQCDFKCSFSIIVVAVFIKYIII